MNIKLAMFSLVFAAGTAAAQPTGSGDATDTGGVQETPASPGAGDTQPATGTGAGSGTGTGSEMGTDRSGVGSDTGDMRDAPAGDTRRDSGAIERDGTSGAESGEAAGEREEGKKRRWWKFWQRDRNDEGATGTDQGGSGGSE